MHAVTLTESTWWRAPAGCMTLGAVLAGQLQVPPEAIALLLSWLLWPAAGAVVLDARPSSVVGRLLCVGALAPGWALLTHGPDMSAAAFVTGSALSPVLLVLLVLPLAARRDPACSPQLLALTAVGLLVVLGLLGSAGARESLTASGLYIGAGLVAVCPFVMAACVVSRPTDLVDAAVLRSLLALGASAGLLLLWVLTLALLARTDLPDQEVAAAVLTGLSAVGLLPLWTALRRRLLARIYGPGRTPGATTVDLAREIRRPQDLDSLLGGLAESVARAVRSPQARVLLVPAADLEQPEEAGAVVALRVGSRSVGMLHVSPRSPGERFSRADMDVLSAVAPQIAVVAQAILVTADLHAAHDRTVTALEADRRRTYSDLHDVLGPLLAGLGMHVEALRGQATGAPELAARLEHVGEGVRACRDAVRTLVQDLHEQCEADGLAEVLTVLIEEWQRAAQDKGLRFCADVPHGVAVDASPRTQLALRRVAAEALTNVVRHAAARQCWISLQQHGDTLELRVADDGIGLDGAVPGIGLSSMQRRLEEVGGELEVRPRSPSGTLLVARAPAVDQP